MFEAPNILLTWSWSNRTIPNPSFWARAPKAYFSVCGRIAMKHSISNHSFREAHSISGPILRICRLSHQPGCKNSQNICWSVRRRNYFGYTVGYYSISESKITCQNKHSLGDIMLRQIEKYLLITLLCGILKLNLQRWKMNYGGKRSRSRERDVLLLWFD